MNRLIALGLMTFVASPAFAAPAGLESLASLCKMKTSDHRPLEQINLATVTISEYEARSLALKCGSGGSFQVVSQSYIIRDGQNHRSESRVSEFKVVEGKLHGQYVAEIPAEATQPGEDQQAQVDQSDIISTSSDLVKVKRNYREIYVIARTAGNNGSIDTGETWVVREVFSLNGKGQPVLQTNRFSSTVDSENEAALIGAKEEDLRSGVYFTQSPQSTLDTCVALSSEADEAKACQNMAQNPDSVSEAMTGYGQGGIQKDGSRLLVFQIPSDRSFGIMASSLGFKSATYPTNNPTSWYRPENRVNFTKNLNELLSPVASQLAPRSFTDAELGSLIADADKYIGGK
jgi:hypothetical protein